MKKNNNSQWCERIEYQKYACKFNEVLYSTPRMWKNSILNSNMGIYATLCFYSFDCTSNK